MGSHICGSVLSSGFSCNEYRPLRLESFSCRFAICQVRILLRGGAGGDGLGGFLHLQNPLSSDGRLWNAATVCAVSLPLILLCPHWAQPQCVRATQTQLLPLPLQFSQWDYTATHHCYRLCRGLGKHQIGSAAPISVLPCPVPTLCLTCPPP